MKSTGCSKNAFCLIIVFIHIVQPQFSSICVKPNTQCQLGCRIQIRNEKGSRFENAEHCHLIEMLCLMCGWRRQRKVKLRKRSPEESRALTVREDSTSDRLREKPSCASFPTAVLLSPSAPPGLPSSVLCLVCGVTLQGECANAGGDRHLRGSTSSLCPGGSRSRNVWGE